MLRTITPIISILIALFVFFFYTQPTFVEMGKVQSVTNQYAQAVEKATELSNTLNKLVETKASHGAENIERLDALVPPTLDEVKILADLSERARSHNMLFGNVSISDSDVPEVGSEKTASEKAITYGQFIYADITFSLIGNYDQFKSFVADLERSLVMTEVVGIDFSAGNGPLQQYEITVRVYSLPALN